MYLVNSICGVLEFIFVRMYKRNFLPAKSLKNRNNTLGDLSICWLRPGKSWVGQVVTHSHIRTELK